MTEATPTVQDFLDSIEAGVARAKEAFEKGSNADEIGKMLRRQLRELDDEVHSVADCFEADEL